jgi:hypothetical protein
LSLVGQFTGRPEARPTMARELLDTGPVEAFEALQDDSLSGS